MARTARQQSSSQAIAVPLHSHTFQNVATEQSRQQERMIKDANRRHRKLESYLADDDNFPSFALQLAKTGLELRDISGDGNCLLRALGDQLEGHGRHHYQHRRAVVNYIREHRSDFEPFIESNVSFNEHLEQLQTLGTHAGNDAIMAFARLHSVDVVIHQLNAAVLIIHGSQSSKPRQLHIAYHNGDHYSSVRKLNDNTESPTNIILQVSNKSHDQTTPHYDKGRGHVNMSERVDHVMRLTGCETRDRARQSLEDNELDTECAISEILQEMAVMNLDGIIGTSSAGQSMDDSGIWSDTGTGTRIFGGECEGGARPKNSLTKKERKQEKQQRAAGRRRDKVSVPQTQPQYIVKM